MTIKSATALRVLWLTSLAVALGVSTPALALQPCGTGDTVELVSLWSGEGNAADVFGDNHGTLEGGVVFVPGMSGQAFSFDGIDDLVRIMDDDSLDPGSNWTLEAWVKPSNWSNWNHLIRGVVHKRYAYGLNLHASFGLLAISFEGNSYTLGFANVDPLVWHHVVLVNGEGLFEGYVDGMQLLSHEVDITMQSNGYDLFIGFDGLRGLHYNGLIDEVAVYNGRLSPEAVAAHHAAGVAGRAVCVSNEEAVAGLVEELEALDAAVGAGLNALAGQALTLLENGNTTAASGLMTGLLHSLEALRDNDMIPQEEADALIATVEALLDALTNNH